MNIKMEGQVDVHVYGTIQWNLGIIFINITMKNHHYEVVKRWLNYTSYCFTFRQTCNDILELTQTQSMGVQGKTKREGRGRKERMTGTRVDKYMSLPFLDHICNSNPFQ
jgi:hypothetical protein